MAIVRALEKWPPKLELVENLIRVLSYHKNLEYFLSNKKSQQTTSTLDKIRLSFQFPDYLQAKEEKHETRFTNKVIQISLFWGGYMISKRLNGDKAG